MSSNKRIQLLRERLELYNATIAEAMGVVTGVTGTEKTAAPNRAEEKSSKSTSGWQRTEGETGGGAAPRLERNLSSEFNAAHAARAAASAAEVAPAGGNSHSSGGGGDQRTVPPPPPSCSAGSSCQEDSTSIYSSASDEAAFVNPFLNEPLSMEEIVASMRNLQRAGEASAVDCPQQRAAGSCASDHTAATDDDEETNTASPSASPAPTPEEAKEEAKKKEENAGAEAVPPFATLETAHYRLSMAEQAVLKLQRTVDIEHVKRVLPQRHKALRLAEARDDLLRREQALRRKESTGGTAAAIYDTDALNLDQQLQQLLADCSAAKALFTRVHERKAAVAEKERLLKKKLSELEEQQREVREKRQALTKLERRNEQREAMLITRGETYRRELEAHKGREQSLQGRIGEVEELGRKVAEWVKILEERDTKIAAKEQRLRRVQTDLVRRSEELLCYRNGRAKAPARMAPRQTSSP
ncbi:uncharacterized protein Tco025E_02654 [Trypanosoma conorhini]|uniref:Uncharacterized protein n=1 Tax=Trypanosoma conorhini TaxID=83891 RepID=A0A422Q2B7_9TRYP|nr:uncharacterized protein Tco025E_02654 [Trypanosoma conorhini]RNF24097.1 hypothetical protein Tco025E_02654 [Trypanosoma conorhini]